IETLLEFRRVLFRSKLLLKQLVVGHTTSKVLKPIKQKLSLVKEIFMAERWQPFRYPLKQNISADMNRCFQVLKPFLMVILKHLRKRLQKIQQPFYLSRFKVKQALTYRPKAI